MKILLTREGVANRFPDRIEINRKLLDDPELFAYVLDRELNHTDKEFSVKDLHNDLSLNFRMASRLFLFTLKNPSVWYELLPIYKRKGKIVYDINMILSYSILITLLVMLGIYFL